MNTSDYLPCPTVKRWREAGASLMNTLEHYKDLCLTLGHESLSEGARPDDLISKLLSAFDLHATVSRQLVECTSALQKVRNTLVSPFFRLPEEITLNIFMHFVYHPKNTEIHRLDSVEHDVHLIYRRLYILIGVCSSWKRIALNGPKLWSVTPMIQGPSASQQPLQLSLQRARASDLHLVATNELPRISGDFIDLLSKHHTRFHAINLSAYDPEVIRDVLDILTEAGNPESLTKLSIRVSDTYHMNSRLPQKLDYVIPHDHPQLDLFTNMLQGLTHFHTSGSLIHWDTLAFSTRLVELMINDVTLGYDEKIIPFIQTLSSASELRDLKMISITTVKSSAFNSNAIKTSLQPTQFPNLQSLLIQNIYFNTLRVLLPGIAPGSHRLTLFLSPRCLRFKILEDVDSDDDEVEDSANVADLCKILEPISVDTLMVTASRPVMRVKPDIIYSILKVMPTLKTLKIDCWTFTQDSWEMLSRPPVAEDSSEKTPFPALENLHLTTATFHTTAGFREMLASHPLRRVVLGAFVTTTMDSQISLERCTTALPWLKNIEQEPQIQLPKLAVLTKQSRRCRRFPFWPMPAQQHVDVNGRRGRRRENPQDNSRHLLDKALCATDVYVTRLQQLIGPNSAPNKFNEFPFDKHVINSNPLYAPLGEPGERIINTVDVEDTGTTGNNEPELESDNTMELIQVVIGDKDNEPFGAFND